MTGILERRGLFARLPLYGWLGLGAILASEAGMFARVEPFYTWHTAIAWTGYILFVDALLVRRRGTSWIRDHPREVLFLAIASIPLWVVFEFFNLYIENWHYEGLPRNLFWRYVGYGWAFATIWPAVFETGELVASLRRAPHPPPPPRVRPIGLSGAVAIAAGAAMLAWPLVWPSPYLAAPVWLGFIFLLDPINARLGGESLTNDLGAGRTDRLVNLAAAGLVCGILWEFWNYWAGARWIYTVPILPEIRVFEMPLLGYGGFPPFAVECFTMYVTVRLAFWRGPFRPISL
jgi:hypothetical protein